MTERCRQRLVSRRSDNYTKILIKVIAINAFSDIVRALWHDGWGTELDQTGRV